MKSKSGKILALLLSLMLVLAFLPACEAVQAPAETPAAEEPAESEESEDSE